MATIPSQKTRNTRFAAYSCLMPFERQSFKAVLDNREKADVLLDKAFQKAAFADQERRFVSTLTYGVLRHWYPLNVLMAWGLSQFRSVQALPSPSAQKQCLKAIDVKLRLLLRLGFYQLFWLNSVPDYALISASLELADQLKLPAKLKKQCHAVLSNAANEKNFSVLAQSIKTIPLWPSDWRSMLLRQFDAASVQQMEESSQLPPAGIWIRVNTLKTSIDSYQQELNSIGIGFEISERLPECLWLSCFQGSPTRLPGFESGWVYVQDISSANISALLAPRPGEQVLDMCAAPGSKTTHMAALMRNQGRITALETSERRAKQLSDNCSRLGVSNVEVLVGDALAWQPEASRMFDRILVDAPCSGSGTVRHQPDSLLQWRKSQADDYGKLQLALLEKATSCLKPGGALVYSTCSLDSRENQDVLDSFLAMHPDWTCTQTNVSMITSKQDGFFAALIKKPES